MALGLNNLASLHTSQGRYTEAESLLKRALVIEEKQFGAEHPHVAIVLENYTALLRKANRPTEAGTMEARAEAIRAKQR